MCCTSLDVFRSASCSGAACRAGRPVCSLQEWRNDRSDLCCALETCRRSGAPETEACEPVEELMTSSKAGRQRSKTVKAAAATVGPRWDVELKDARYLYLSVDEASTHVGKRFFRLLTGACVIFAIILSPFVTDNLQI